MTKMRLLLHRRAAFLIACLIVGAVVGAVSAAVGSSGSEQTSWEAKQFVFVDLTKAGNNGSGFVSQGAEQVTRGGVPARAAAILGGKQKADELVEDITAKPLVDSNSIEISSLQTDKTRAAKMVAAFAQAFVEVENTKLSVDSQAAFDQVQERVAVAKRELDAFDAANTGATVDQSALLSAQRYTLSEQYRSASLDFVQAKQALDDAAIFYLVEPGKPEKVASVRLGLPSSPPLRIALFVFVTAVLGLGLVLALEKFSPRFDTTDEIVEALGVPVIGEVGSMPRAMRHGKEAKQIALEGANAEAYRRLRSAFEFVMDERGSSRNEPESMPTTGPDRSGRSNGGGQKRSAAEAEPVAAPQTAPCVFLIVSAAPDEGKSTTCAMVGAAMAEAGLPTLVLGCDYRRPKIDRLLGVPGARGITSRVEMSMDRPELAEIIYETKWDGLWVAPSGRPTRSVIGCDAVAKELIGAAREHGINVLVDTTPVLVANDAMDLVDSADEIVLIIRAGQTTRHAAEQTLEQIRLHGREVLGAVLIGSVSMNKAHSYYEYYASPEWMETPEPNDDDGPVTLFSRTQESAKLN
ncbi:MAG: hypothetical protein V9E99_03460 [Microthrixaceae bacterium]|jgi:Mrp family chromosome partitioning ATPase|nr:hypothetical protein [Microthrixaceae bacterium]HMT24003.1 hypothetical protein [Microthrixaceae bacterium]HMT60033.1 hypothetical protein [Microthrixaceae bacterium]